MEIKHARTGAAKKRRKKEESDDEDEEFACKKCGEFKIFFFCFFYLHLFLYSGHGDHPEWILLCDSCDVGWHASCLRPALMVIPEGAWFCPDCNHKTLLTALTDKLSELDSLLKKTEAERRRKERLAFINKSLSKTLPTTQKKESNKKYESSSDESSSETDSEDDLLLPRKCRTKNPVNYNTEEFDQMMNKALSSDLKYQRKQAPPAISEESDEEEDEESGEEESDKVSPGKPRAGQGKGKNIDNYSEESEEEEQGGKKPKPIKMKINKMKGGKKKRKKLTNLNASDESDDGDSGSDFRLSEEMSEDADDFIDDGGGSDSEEYNYGKKKKGRGGGQPSRRSTRSRRSRLDDDFVVDGSDSEDYAPKKKKSKWASETSEEER